MLVLYVCACTVVVGCLLQYLNQFKEVDQVVMKYALGDACVRVATNKVLINVQVCPYVHVEHVHVQYIMLTAY